MRSREAAIECFAQITSGSTKNQQRPLPFEPVTRRIHKHTTRFQRSHYDLNRTREVRLREASSVLVVFRYVDCEVLWLVSKSDV